MIKRTEGRHNANFKGKEFYKAYRKEVTKPLTEETYNKVRNLFYKLLIEKLYEESQVKLPKRFGTVKILKTKRRIVYNDDGSINKIGYKVDWKKTKDYWAEKYPGKTPEDLKLIMNKPKIYCESEWRYSFNWRRTSAKFVNKTLVWMLVSRNTARGLNTFMKTNPHIDYKEK